VLALLCAAGLGIGAAQGVFCQHLSNGVEFEFIVSVICHGVSPCSWWPIPHYGTQKAQAIIRCALPVNTST